MKKQVLIDTDPGIDDALALILALNSPELEIKAITTVSGNVDVHTATQNVLTILELFPARQPVLAKGAAKPLIREPFYARNIHGIDGLGTSQASGDIAGRQLSRQDIPLSCRDAPDEILHQLSQTNAPLELIALGPLTNVALAIDKNPEVCGHIQQIVLMGGAYASPGNITPAAEFNILVDPEAAEQVFNSGLNIMAVGLDVSRQLRLNRQTIDNLIKSRNSEISRCIKTWTEQLLEYMERTEGSPSMPLHDPLTVMACLYPELLQTENMHVLVETRGEHTLGMTVADRRPLRQEFKAKHNLRVCTAVNGPECLRRFLERMS